MQISIFLVTVIACDIIEVIGDLPVKFIF